MRSGAGQSAGIEQAENQGENLGFVCFSRIDLRYSGD